MRVVITLTYRDIAGMVKESSILKPWRMDVMLRNDMVPSSKNSSAPSLLLTKSMSAMDAATVPGKQFIGEEK